MTVPAALTMAWQRARRAIPWEAALDDAYALVALGAVLGGFVQGLSGFAFGLTATSIWAWALSPRPAAVLAVFGALTGQLVRPSRCGAAST